MLNHRRAPRAPINALAHLTNEPSLGQAWVRQAGPQGLFLQVTRQPSRIHDLEVRFDLPGHGPVDCTVEVRSFLERGGLWTMPEIPGSGCRIVHLLPADKTALTQYVKQQKELFLGLQFELSVNRPPSPKFAAMLIEGGVPPDLEKHELKHYVQRVIRQLGT